MNVLWEITFLTSWNFVYVCSISRRKGEVTYSLEFLSSLSNCENFINEYLDMSNMKIQFESPKSNFLNGTIAVKEDMGTELMTEVSVAVYKETGMGREFFYLLSSDFCSHLNDKDMIWTQFFNILRATNCPIKANTYNVERLKFNLDFAKNVMKHEYVGDYYMTVSLQRAAQAQPYPAPARRISCHAVQLAVVEAKSDDK